MDFGSFRDLLSRQRAVREFDSSRPWLARKYGRSKRRPVTEVTYRDRYGRAW